MDKILLIIIFFVVVFYLFIHFKKEIKNKKSCNSNCGHCSYNVESCSKKENEVK